MAKPPARRRWADANGVAKPKLDYCALGRPRLKFLENAPFAQASQPNSNADGNSAMANPSRKAPITPPLCSPIVGIFVAFFRPDKPLAN